MICVAAKNKSLFAQSDKNKLLSSFTPSLLHTSLAELSDEI